jgi:endonuclease-8
MEGPSIVIVIEEARKFIGSRVEISDGSSKVIDVHALQGQTLLNLRSWGKHFLLIFEQTTLKVHFLMFGTYRIDEERPGVTPHLSLTFKSGNISMYACSIRELVDPLSSIYDWRVDVMAPEWDEAFVVEKLENTKDTLVCDVLLDQNTFAGSGNIIKNEVLFRMKLHPETPLDSLTRTELQLLARETRLYAFQFYIWKKQYLLRKNWQIYSKKSCPDCGSKVTLKPTGKSKRRSFFCPVCQDLQGKAVSSKARRERLAVVATQLAELKREMPTITAQGTIEREH